MPEEVPLGEDCKDWATKLNDRERQPADPDLPLLHAIRRRGERQLHGALRPRLQTD